MLLFPTSMAATNDLKEALLQLNKVKKERPALAPHADFFMHVLPGLFEGESNDRPPPMTQEQAQAKLAEGVPLLREESVEIDLATFQRRWLHVAAAIERHQNAAAGETLATVVHQDRWNPRAIVAAVLAGAPPLLQNWADERRLDSSLTATVARLSLFPSLVNLREQLLTLGRHSAWQRGYCPMCGSWPLLAEFRGLEQTRLLRCGWCAAEWKVPRLFCPFCENRDHHSLGYLIVEGDGSKYRINTCDSCRSYLKMVTTLGPLTGPQLLAADVVTIHLDIAALEKGYGAQKIVEE